MVLRASQARICIIQRTQYPGFVSDVREAEAPAGSLFQS